VIPPTRDPIRIAVSFEEFADEEREDGIVAVLPGRIADDDDDDDDDGNPVMVVINDEYE
jgi:hypothetical protein